MLPSVLRAAKEAIKIKLGYEAAEKFVDLMEKDDDELTEEERKEKRKHKRMAKKLTSADKSSMYMGGFMSFADGGMAYHEGGMPHTGHVGGNNYKDGGYADGGKLPLIPNTSEEINAKIATIMVEAKLNGHVTDTMKAELEVLGDQLRMRIKADSIAGKIRS